MHNKSTSASIALWACARRSASTGPSWARSRSSRRRSGHRRTSEAAQLLDLASRRASWSTGPCRKRWDKGQVMAHLAQISPAVARTSRAWHNQRGSIALCSCTIGTMRSSPRCHWWAWSQVCAPAWSAACTPTPAALRFCGAVSNMACSLLSHGRPPWAVKGSLFHSPSGLTCLAWSFSAALACLSCASLLGVFQLGATPAGRTASSVLLACIWSDPKSSYAGTSPFPYYSDSFHEGPLSMNPGTVWQSLYAGPSLAS